jgi:hypothetical protein
MEPVSGDSVVTLASVATAVVFLRSWIARVERRVDELGEAQAETRERVARVEARTDTRPLDCRGP